MTNVADRRGQKKTAQEENQQPLRSTREVWGVVVRTRAGAESLMATWDDHATARMWQGRCFRGDQARVARIRITTEEVDGGAV